MSLTKKAKIIISIGVIVGVIAITTPILGVTLVNYYTTTKVTLLNNAGIMIESRGIRIYIDPVELTTDYADLPADVILITHPHGDHYQGTIINMLQKEDTVNVFPASMTAAITQYDGIGVNPTDQFEIGHITITAFYMYTLPVGEYPASHPREENYTSYIIDIDGFTLFHAGDSKNIPEYAQLTGTIDVAMLPLGPGCQTMVEQEVVNVIYILRSDYMIPLHYTAESFVTFNAYYVDNLEAANCQYIGLANYEMYKFKI